MEPKLNSPLTCPSEVVGLKEMARDSVGIVFWLNKLSITVGTAVVPDTVPRNSSKMQGDSTRIDTPSVRSTGPMLYHILRTAEFEPWYEYSPENSIDITESGGVGSYTNRLILDYKIAAQADLVSD